MTLSPVEIFFGMKLELRGRATGEAKEFSLSLS